MLLLPVLTCFLLPLIGTALANEYAALVLTQQEDAVELWRQQSAAAAQEVAAVSWSRTHAHTVPLLLTPTRFLVQCSCYRAD